MTILDVERCDIGNLSSLVILLVGVEELSVVNPPGVAGLKLYVESLLGNCGEIAAVAVGTTTDQ